MKIDRAVFKKQAGKQYFGEYTSMHRSKDYLVLVFVTCLIVVFGACNSGLSGNTPKETKTIRIICTSDLHGKFLPWDYALNQESLSGSMAQLSTAIKKYRTDNSLLVDAGDSIQDNSAEIFLDNDDVHPMIRAINALDYDVWVTGNHEYDYGLDITKKTITDLDCKVLTGNVYDENGEPIAEGYTIFDMDGIRVAVIGMVTPNIIRWNAAHLQGCTVTYFGRNAVLLELFAKRTVYVSEYRSF